MYSALELRKITITNKIGGERESTLKLNSDHKINAGVEIHFCLLHGHEKYYVNLLMCYLLNVCRCQKN